MRGLLEVYQRLRGRFGHRRWWPGETPFEVAVGAILTQAVAWVNVEKAISALKAEGLLTAAALRDVADERLQVLIRPSRYPNVKARKLKEFVGFLDVRYKGDMAVMAVGETQTLRRELLAVWGIGPETADSILLYALDKPIFVVDAYTKRIFSRLGYWPEKSTYECVQEFFQSRLPAELELYNEYHAQIVALGNNLCFPQNPKCRECPLEDICGKGGREAGAGRLPRP